MHRIIWNAIAWRFQFTGTTGPSTNHEKQPQTKLFLLHQNVQLPLCICAGWVLLASSKPRFVLRNHIRVKCDSSLQRMCFHCSIVHWWRALHHSSRGLALRMVILGLCAATRPWKPISWSSWWTVLVLTLLRGNLELIVSIAIMDRQVLRTSALFSKAILLSMFVYWDCAAVCSILYTCQQQVWLK
jgi:hypothetical protein